MSGSAETEALEDITASVADAVSHGILVTESDGSIAYSNSAVAPLLGLDGAIASLEAALSREPKAAEALFRMLRAVERGQSHAEEISLPAKGAVSEAEAARRVLPVCCLSARLARPTNRRTAAPCGKSPTSPTTAAAKPPRSMSCASALLLRHGLSWRHRRRRRQRHLSRQRYGCALVGPRNPCHADKGARLTDILSADAIQLLWAQARKTRSPLQASISTCAAPTVA